MPRAGLSRSAVVQIALTVVDETRSGFADLTLAAVAARAGVAVPSLYKHVRSIDDLRRAVALLAIDELTAVLVAAGQERTGAAALTAQAHAIRDHARRHPGRYAALQVAPDPLAPQDAALRVAAARTVQALADALNPGPAPGPATADRRGPPDQDELVHTVRTVRSAVHGFVTLELGGGFGLPQDIDESFEHLVRTLVTGLRLT